MIRLPISLLLYALPVLGALAGNSTNAEPKVVNDLCAKLPGGWNCTVYQSNDVKVVPHGLGKPLFQVVASNTSLSVVMSTNASRPRMQSPVIPLYFYRHSEKADLMKI